MGNWHRASSWVAPAALAGAAFVVGGCSLIYDFAYTAPLGSGGGGGESSASSASSSTSSTSGGVGGSGGADPCMPPTPACGVETIAISEAQSAPFVDIVLGTQNVYWRASAGVAWVPKKIPPPNPNTVLLSYGITNIAGIDDTAIFAGNIYEIRRLSPAFDNLEDFVVSSMGSKTDLTDMVVNDTFVYWPSSADSIIYKADINLAVPVKPAVAEDGKGSDPMAVLGAIAASPAPKDIYWIYRNDATTSGGIMAYAQPNAIEFEKFSTTKPVALAVDADAVYWLTSNGVAHRRLKAPGSPIVDSKPLGMVSAAANLEAGKIVVGDKHVYWLGPTAHTCSNGDKGCGCGVECGAIMAARKIDLANPVIFATGSWDSLNGLAVDSENVYWTAGVDKGSDRLLRKAVLP